MCPLEKGVRGIEIGHQMPGRSWRAGKAIVAMESPKALMCPLEKGDGGINRNPRGFNKSSSDDRPGPGICGSKYVEDAKAARSVRVWDRVPIKLERISDAEMYCATILFKPAVRSDPSPALTPGRIVDDHTHIQTYKDEIQV